MTCADARERFSELIDGRLAADDRMALDGHLAGCSACGHELDRFRDTVALVRSLAPARAPAGFVDRVAAAAHPRPWWRRAAAGAFFPLPVKLPIQAAAVVLVGVGVAYVFQRTPELRKAVVDEAPRVTLDDRSARPETPPAKPDSPRPLADAPAAPPVAAERRATAPTPAAEPPPAPRAKAETTAPRESAAQSRPREADDKAGSERPAPAAPPARSARDEPRQDSTDLARRPETRAERQTMAKAVRRPADVTTTLRVESRPVAEGAVRDLISRHRGAVDATHAGADAIVIEARIPHDEYPKFAAALGGVGRREPERETDLPAEVRVTIRLE